MLWSVAYGQSKVYIRGDSIYIQRNGGNGELILENGTRNITGGVLTNMGNGRTKFVVPTGGGVDSIWREPGKDSIKYRKNGITYAIKDSVGGGSGVVTADSLLKNYNQVPFYGHVFLPTDTVYVYTDSYGSATGATATEKGWVQQLTRQLGCVVMNFTVSGSPIQKRSPVDYNGTANMIDRLGTIPPASQRAKFMIIAMGLNDVGQTAAAYNTANYATDYDSVLNYIITTKGWNPRDILLIPPYYIGQAGYNAYNVITGNAAQTAAVHRNYVYTTRQRAVRWGTLYLDLFDAQYRNDTTLFNADAIHANNAGYDNIYKIIWSYLGTGVNANLWVQTGTGSSVKYTPRGVTTVAAAVSPPFQIDLGATYSSVQGSSENLKSILYNDGSINNISGWGIDTRGVYGNSFDGWDLYRLQTRIATFNGSSSEIIGTTRITVAGTGSTTNFFLNHSSSYGATGNETRFVYGSVSTELGALTSYYDGTGFGLKGYVHSGSVLQEGWTIKGNRTMGFGGNTSPTAWVHPAAGTTTIAPQKYTSGSLLTTPEVGAKEYNNGHYETNNALNRYGLGGVIFSNSSTVTNDGTNPTTFSTYTTKANTLNATEEKIIFEYSGTIDDASPCDLDVTFAGTNIGSFPPAGGGMSWRITGTIVRTGSSTATADVQYHSNSVSQSVLTKLTGLTFSGTNILLLTGTSATGATDDLTKELAEISWRPAAAN